MSILSKLTHGMEFNWGSSDSDSDTEDNANSKKRKRVCFTTYMTTKNICINFEIKLNY
jgi:hypothetical protein